MATKLPSDFDILQFMESIQEKVKQILATYEAIMKVFDLSGKETKLLELESKTLEQDLWKDQEKARKVMQKFGDLKKEIEEFKSLGEEIKTLSSLVDEGIGDEGLRKEIIGIEERINKFNIKSYLSGLYDGKNALVSIHAGQGGVEAMDWASMLYRMYLRFCERKGWEVEVIHISEGEEAGIKSITFGVSGSFVYGNLKYEAGTHRLVRQSPFNADKLRQTSFALVEVMPEFEEVDLPDIEIKDSDLEWQFFRASSQGGQNVQKVSSAVRLKHIPTEIVVTAQTERYQEQNRKYALILLRAKLWALEQKKSQENLKDIKGEYRPASWGNQIRSYVLHPYKMIKDLRTGCETSNTEKILDGEIDEFIETEIQTLKNR